MNSLTERVEKIILLFFVSKIEEVMLLIVIHVSIASKKIKNMKKGR